MVNGAETEDTREQSPNIPNEPSCRDGIHTVIRHSGPRQEGGVRHIADSVRAGLYGNLN